MPCAKLLEIECLNCKVQVLPESTDLMWRTNSLRLRLRDVGHESTAALVDWLKADQTLTLRRTERCMPPPDNFEASDIVSDYVEIYKKHEGIAEETNPKNMQFWFEDT